ncbi:MAG TPA: hypothetical protein DCW97_03205 [Acidobacteria bacterium]|nr:hypothetical protein [Acidobacteriota bacterium]
MKTTFRPLFSELTKMIASKPGTRLLLFINCPGQLDCVQEGQRYKKGWLVRSQGFKGKGSGAKEDPSPASNLIIINRF